MVDYVSFQSMMNRLGLDQGVILGIEFEGEYDNGEILIGDNSLAEAEVIQSNNPWVRVRFREVGSPVNHFQYNENIVGQGSGKQGELLFAESTFLDELIKEATDDINNCTNRIFGDATLQKTKAFDVYDDQVDFWLGEDPIVSIDEITYREEVVSWVEKVDYWLYPNEGLIKVVKGKVASGNPQNLRIKFTYGSSTVPFGIRSIAKEMVVNVFEDYQRQRNARGADKLSMADFSVTFVKRDPLTDEIENRLQKWRKVNTGSF